VSLWIFLRHGESEANQKRVFSGHQDVALTQKGEAQAQAAGLTLIETLQGQSLSRVLSSDLQRAVRTAELSLESAAQTQEIHQTTALRERHLGEWQGESIDKLKAQGSRAVLHRWTGHAPGGESLEALAIRSVTYLAGLDEQTTNLLVGHGGLIRVLLGLLDGEEKATIGRVNIPNAVPIVREVSSGKWADLLRELTG